MKYLIICAGFGLLIAGLLSSHSFGAAIPALQIWQGGTGSTSTPSYGQLWVGNNSNGMTLTATSSLGITASETYTGTVTSVDASVPTGLSVSGVPITTAGTIALTYTAGYAIPTTTRMLNWDLASTHKTTEDALNGLVKVDGSGVYSAITDSSSNWNTAYTNRITSATYPLSISSNTISTVATSSLNLLVGSFLSPNISQWTNDSVYLTAVASDADWTVHASYPAACGAGQYISALGDTSTCGTPTGTVIGTVSTSTTPLLGGIAYWTSTGYPSLLGTVATGTVSGAGGITVTAGRSAIGGSLAITCTAADTNNTGCLSDTDWDTFNGKITTIGSGTNGQLSYWRGANDLTGIGTTTLTATSPLSLDNPVVKVGGSNSILSISTAGTWSGLAGTASALASNPTDCAANTWATTIAANGDLTCAAVTSAGITDAASYFDNRLTGTTTLSKLTTLTGLTTIGSGTGFAYLTAGALTASTTLYLGTGTTTSNNGINISAGCFAVGGTCVGGGSTYTATYPVTLTGSAFGLAFGTTTSNTWAGLQTFANATGTQLSLTDGYLNINEAADSLAYTPRRLTVEENVTHDPAIYFRQFNSADGWQWGVNSSNGNLDFYRIGEAGGGILYKRMTLTLGGTLNAQSIKATSTLLAGSNNGYVTGTTTIKFNFASTTMTSYSTGFGFGTTTLQVPSSEVAFTMAGVYCKATSTAATTNILLYQFADGAGNYTNTATCNTAGIYTTITTNNTFTAWEDINIVASSTGGNIDRAAWTVTGYKTSN